MRPDLKRAFDILGATFGLILSVPIIVLVAVAVRVKLGSPVLFRQRRPGLRGQAFTMYKFRTMLDARDTDGQLLPPEERMTPTGQRLRETSLDELPELWNVMRGEMSLVGPRPLLMDYLPLYSDRQARRHEVRPGMTGWAQIHGRNLTTWEKRLELDVWYVENQSLKLDFWILLLTFKKVLFREGVTPLGRTTMERFRGTQG